MKTEFISETLSGVLLMAHVRNKKYLQWNNGEQQHIRGRETTYQSIYFKVNVQRIVE